MPWSLERTLLLEVFLGVPWSVSHLRLSSAYLSSISRALPKSLVGHYYLSTLLRLSRSRS